MRVYLYYINTQRQGHSNLTLIVCHSIQTVIQTRFCKFFVVFLAKSKLHDFVNQSTVKSTTVIIDINKIHLKHDITMSNLVM